uniref:Succinate-semialdehyde dehydrogenase [NADP(+)] 1 n=1 Tax=Anthurium amnicola TaxID=1678845 RepID=A0A1D1ZBG6_9ARAE
MEETRRILRRSAHAFLSEYQAVAATAALLVFPFSASVLLSQALAPSSSPLLGAIRSRVATLFAAVTGSPPASSELFSFLGLKFSQTIFSVAFTFPFTLTFLVLAKASVIQLVCGRVRRRGPSPLLLRLYHPLLQTHLCNALLVLSANGAVFSLLFLAFNAADALALAPGGPLVLCLSAAGAVLYSVVLANALVACNLAVIVSGVEGCGGYLPVLKACMLIRGRTATALSLALPTNLFMAAAEALFQVRVVRPYGAAANRLTPSLASEAAVITYVYSLLIILDIVVSCMFFKSCKPPCPSSDREVEWNCPSGIFSVEEEQGDADATSFTKLKFQEQP